jgi:hypothetical protein
MKHKIVSFYKDDLNPEIVKYQKKVFDFFNVSLEQFSFTDHSNHASAIENYLENNTDWDFISIFDVDCIPIKGDFLEKAIEIIKDENTIYGNIQASNIFDINLYKSPPFVAPHFLNFTKKLWEESNWKSFQFQWYPNPDGKLVEADVAEVFTRENEKQGRNIVYAYPTHIYKDHTWKYDGSFGYPKFNLGNSTEFESGTYHNYQIRIEDKAEFFIPYCKKIINEN